LITGFNSTLREGNVTHHEYMQVGKGRDVGLNQISLFEAKIANGNGEQTLSRDVYRLGHRFDFFRMLSCYYTTIGFYFSTMVQTSPLTFQLSEPLANDVQLSCSQRFARVSLDSFIFLI
jgi:hypothetical protein